MDPGSQGRPCNERVGAGDSHPPDPDHDDWKLSQQRRGRSHHPAAAHSQESPLGTHQSSTHRPTTRHLRSRPCRAGEGCRVSPPVSGVRWQSSSTASWRTTPSSPHSTPLESSSSSLCTLVATFFRLAGTVLYFSVLHCTVQHCTVLQCTVLYCTVLHCSVLHCTALHCTALHSTVQYSTVQYSTIPTSPGSSP